MNNIVVYSSKTGNTKMVGEAIAKAYNLDCKDVAEVSPVDLQAYDNVIVGFWADKGTADQKALKFLEELQSLNLGLFMTLGAEPDTEHAKSTMNTVVELVEKKGNVVKATFMCQGKIDPKLTEMFKKMGDKSPHKWDEARMKRHEEAAKHPDENDLKNAVKAFEEICNAI